MGSPASFLLIGLFLLWLVFTKRAKKMIDAILNPGGSDKPATGTGQSTQIPMQAGTANQFGGLTNITYTGQTNGDPRYLGPPLQGRYAMPPYTQEDLIGQGWYWN
jgi:hypothetical protein